MSVEQCCGLLRGWRGACSCVIGVGKAEGKSITALKSENINVSPPGSQGCGTLEAVMASLACTDGGSRHSSAAQKLDSTDVLELFHVCTANED